LELDKDRENLLQGSYPRGGNAMSRTIHTSYRGKVMRKLFVPIVLGLLTAGLAPQAHADPVQFSAVMVQTLPEQKTMTMKIYVGDGVMRTETTHDDQTRINIVDTKNHVAWMLNPAKKEYVEMRGPAPTGGAAPSRPPLPDEANSPCQQHREDFRCTKLGEETINGRRLQKWEFATTQGGQTMRSLVWIDPRLRTPVRQEFPGGYVSELRDIQEGPQPPSLFQVPKDYTKIDMPASPQGHGAQRDGGQPRY
jgi:hypothetical protein